MINDMINIDQYIVGFCRANPITIFMAIMVLKAVAVMTKNTVDNKIATLVSNMFAAIPGVRRYNSAPSLDPGSRITGDVLAGRAVDERYKEAEAGIGKNPI